jgi:uncharacterized membrane protein
LAPAIGELLSGSSPPLEFFNPISFLLLASLYGSGAIVARELKIRWKKDFRALLLLGAAYGILEEGLMVKSFFDPAWMDLGILGSFGRWANVNWVWAEMLIIYHAVFSITIPIVLVELTFPERKEESWVGSRYLKGFIAVLATVTAIGFFFLTRYVPPLLNYLMAILAMFTFVYAAYRLPTHSRNMETHKKANAKRLWITGLASATAFFLLFWIGPYLFVSPIIVMTLGSILVFGTLRRLRNFRLNHPESSVDRLAIVAGALSFLIILAPLMELDRTRPDNPVGMTLVSISAVILLLLLRRRLSGKSLGKNISA